MLSPVNLFRFEPCFRRGHLATGLAYYKSATTELTMAVSSGMSFLLSSTMSVLLFAGMQMYRQQLASREYLTIVGGFIGSLLFVLVLTAVGNLENAMFGRDFKTKLFPEVAFCLAVAMFASGLVHRVCVTTCFIFSIVAVYYINKIAITSHTPPAPVTGPGKGKKRN